jgi:hypothetical protein
VPSHRPARLLAAAALALVLPLSACTTTSHSSRCSGGTCTVNLTGVQTFEVDGVDGYERDLGVGPIEPDAVTLSVYGEQARLTPGQAGVVNEVPVEVVSVSGRDVTLRIGATEVESADDDDDDSSASGVHLKRTTAKATKTPRPTATTRATTTTTKATATKTRSATSSR